jgi:hypothetical protein
VNITAGGVFLVQGDLVNTDLFFNQLFIFTAGVARATIHGEVSNSQIITNDVIGDLVIGSMRNSIINVGGTPGNSFFSPGTSFAQTGYARSITIGSTGSRELNFVSSSIIGNRIDAIRIVGVDTLNANLSFGISARTLGSIELVMPEGPRRFSNPSEPFFLNDFEIRPNFVEPNRA